MSKRLFLLAAFVLPAACATTPQRNAEEEAPGVFRVHLNGDATATQDALVDAFKRQIAEVCAEHGGKKVAAWKVSEENTVASRGVISGRVACVAP